MRTGKVAVRHRRTNSSPQQDCRLHLDVRGIAVSIGARGRRIRCKHHKERRGGERLPFICSCPYELHGLAGGGGGRELFHGHAFSIDVSSGGMLLLLPHAPPEKQVFEVRVPSVDWAEGATKVVEVCWTRQVCLCERVRVHLVGVKILFEVPASR